MSPIEAETMTAIAIEGGKGPASALRPEPLPIPRPADGQILIRVHAAGVNRPDLLQRMGGYPPPPGSPATMGLEVAGEVAVGGGRWKAGDRVCALLGGGGYAQYAVCDARHALPIPGGLQLRAGRGPARDRLHGLRQRVRARRPEDRRDPAAARRHVGHRRDRDPDGKGGRRPGDRHRPGR